MNKNKLKCSCGRLDKPCNIHFSRDPNTWVIYSNYYSVERTPINIITNKTITSYKNLININYTITPGYYFDNGYTIEYHVDEKSSYVSLVDDLEHNKKFYLKQFHFHNASENSIDGRFYPFEIHFVHEHISPTSEEHLVVSILCQLSNNKKQLEFIKNAFDNLESKEKTEIDLSILNKLTNNIYYKFPGTLTTPPFNRISHGWYLWFYDETKTIELLINNETYQKFCIIYQNNRANIIPCDARYAEPLDKNYLSIHKIMPLSKNN